MRRVMYRLLLRFHPAIFRNRFGAEMLEIFENEGEPLRLILDALFSLSRQWTLRPEFRRECSPAVASYDNIPSFHLIEPDRLGVPALVEGGLIALAVLFGLVTVLGQEVRHPRFLIGSYYPRPHLFAADRSSLAGSGLDTIVSIRPKPEDPLRRIAAQYFKRIRVLAVLDRDQDLIITPSEIRAAPGALWRLDMNHDRKLSAEECGFRMAGASSPQAVEQAKSAFMRENPVLAALDSNHDGEISAAEVENSPATLKKLDRNGDGSLEAWELLPHAR